MIFCTQSFLFKQSTLPFILQLGTVSMWVLRFSITYFWILNVFGEGRQNNNLNATLFQMMDSKNKKNIAFIFVDTLSD